MFLKLTYLYFWRQRYEKNSKEKGLGCTIKRIVKNITEDTNSYYLWAGKYSNIGIMKKYLITLFILFTFAAFSQDTLYYPVDIVYNEAAEEYYVSNWADGAGYILKLNSGGEIESTFATGFSYPGGLCLIDNILYIDDNSDLYGGSLPSYLKGYNINTGEQVLNIEISTGGTYLDLMDTDNNGFLYIGDTEKQKIYKFNLETYEVTDFLTGLNKPFGVFYDYISDRIIYTSSSSSLSYLRAVNTDGTGDEAIFYTTGYLEGIEMSENGDFYISSWGTPDGAWGNEPVYKSSHNLDWKMVISNDNNRPYGMCIGKDNFLAVCNWGSHSINFLDLSQFSVNENLYEGKINLFPNPSNGHFKIEIDDISSKNVEILIYDLPGKLVYSEKINLFSNKLEKEFGLTLKTGTYIVRIKDGLNVYTKKLMINN